jgi:hypothetical protein
MTRLSLVKEVFNGLVYTRSLSLGSDNAQAAKGFLKGRV